MVKDIMIEHDTQTEYNLSKPIDELLEQQKNDPFDLSVEMNQEIFKGQLEDGFFIEAGAFEGDPPCSVACLTGHVLKVTRTLTVFCLNPSTTGPVCWSNQFKLMSSSPKTENPGWHHSVLLQRPGLTL